MKKENQKFIFQLLTFGVMIAFAFTGHDYWALTMLFLLVFVIQ
jgi:hypothetical protein